MKYEGIDYNKPPYQNMKHLFDSICYEVVVANEVLFDSVKRVTLKHIEKMILETHETDKNRDVLLKLEPTWKAMKKELESITF
jgi:hypothetical protein